MQDATRRTMDATLKDRANEFICQLRGTRDDDSGVQQQRDDFIRHVRAFVTAWDTFRCIYHRSLNPRPTFDHVLRCLIDDSTQILADLSQKLKAATVAERREKGKAMFFFCRPVVRPTGTLVKFFGGDTTCLRQVQILYATTVVDLISCVVDHVENHGYIHSTRRHRADVQRQQLEIVRRQKQAKQVLHEQGRHIRDNLVHSYHWLLGAEWTDEADRLPFELVASAWFHTDASDHSNLSPPGGGGDLVYGQMLREMQDRVQNLEDTVRRCEENADARCQRLEENLRAEFAEQERVWDAKIERLNDQIISLTEQRTKLIEENERLKAKAGKSKQETSAIEGIDKAIAKNEGEQEFAEAHKRGINQVIGVRQSRNHASDLDDGSPSANARDRNVLQFRRTQGSQSRSRYPPQARVNIPDLAPQSNFGGSQYSVSASSATLCNAVSTSHAREPSIGKYSHSRSNSRPGSQDASLAMWHPQTPNGLASDPREAHPQDRGRTRDSRSRRRSGSSNKGRRFVISNNYMQDDADAQWYNSQLSPEAPRQRSGYGPSQPQNLNQESNLLNLGLLTRFDRL